MQDQQDKEQHRPLVSFVIAYYNLPTDWLCQCINSIRTLSLQREEREIIVVDDGSSDSPLTAINAFSDEIVYIRQENGGLSAARNRGISVASGQYLQFVDADDYLVTSPYNHCIDVVRSQQPDVLMFNFVSNDDNQQEVFSTYTANRAVSGTEYMFHFNIHSAACGYLFKRDILGGLRFTHGIYHEDEEFTPLLLLRAESVYSTDARAYYYRRRPHSITTDDSNRQTVKRLSDMKQVMVKLSLMADTLPHLERQALQRRVAQLTMDHIYNIIVLTHDRHYLDRKLNELRRDGLFPLPDRNYTTKYIWFRRFTNSNAGLFLLMRVLPLMNKKR